MEKDKKSSFTELKIYTEISSMSQELRISIRQMRRSDRFDVGDEIRQQLRQIKYLVSDIHRKPNTCKYAGICDLLSALDHLSIALSDCIEDGSLSLSGRFSISLPLSRLDNIIDQAEHWKTYIQGPIRTRRLGHTPNIPTRMVT